MCDFQVSSCLTRDSLPVPAAGDRETCSSAASPVLEGTRSTVLVGHPGSDSKMPPENFAPAGADVYLLLPDSKVDHVGTLTFTLE